MVFIGTGTLQEVKKKVINDRGLISQEKYYTENSAKLSDINCPVCNEKNCLFTGFFWIQCRNCINLYVTPEELSGIKT